MQQGCFAFLCLNLGMGKKFKMRELLSRYPWLDTVRMNFLEWVCTDGIGFFDRSYRIVKFVAPGAAKLLTGDATRQPLIMAIYHGRMVGLLAVQPRKRVTILISPSRDGEMIARGMLGMGYSVVRGSSKQGGVKGALELIDAVEEGQDLAFMVDGPRGPKFVVKPGIIRIAEMTQVPIVPYVCSSRSTWWMGSWDRFMAAWWSTPTICMYGEPLYVPKDASPELQEELRLQLESRMEHMRMHTDNFWAISI